MAYNAGTAFLQVVPSFRHIDREIAKGLNDLGREFGKALDGTLPEGFQRAAQRATREAAPSMGQAGRGLAGTFATAFGKRVEAAFKALPEVEITADSSDADKAVHALRRELAELHDKHIGVDIDEVRAMAAMLRLKGLLAEITGGNVSVELNADTDKARRELLGFFDDVRTEAQEAADAAAKAAAQAAERARHAAVQAARELEEQERQASGVFALALRKRLDAAVKALPRVELTAQSTDVERAVAALREQLGQLRDQRIGVDIDEVAAMARLLQLQGLLRRITDANVSVEINADTDKARAELAAFFADIQTETQRAAVEATRAAAEAAAKEAERAQRAAVVAAQRQADQAQRDAAKAAGQAGKDAADAFSRTFAGQVQTAVRTAMQRLPALRITATSTQAERTIAVVRSQLAALGDARIGVDIDENTFLVAIGHLRERLEELSDTDAQVQFRFDAAAGAAELAVVDEMIDHLDGRTADVDLDVDADRALRSLAGLGEVTQVNIGRLGLLIATGASIGTAIVPAASAAATAVGFIGTAAAASTIAVGVLVLGFSGIGDAVSALGDAQDSAATSSASLARSDSQVASAVDQISTAERNLANTRANNADAARRAARDVEQAELTLAKAHLDVRRAQQDLTTVQRDLTRAREEAREQAKRALEDLALALAENRLRQRQAILDVAEAKEALDKLLANPRATVEEREQARITYEQALLQQQQLGVQQQRLTEDRKAAAKVQVDGSERVRAAQERVADATARVAQAQRGLADAVAAQQSQQRQAANAVADAQQQLLSAQRALAKAYTSAGVAGGGAVDKVRAAMDKLSPTGQRFARWVFGLKDEFYRLRAAASDGLLSGVQSAISSVLPSLPRLIRFVEQVSDTLGELAGRAVAELRDPTFRRLFAYIETTAVPTITLLFTAGANIARGMAGLFLAFTPLTGDAADGLLEVTQRFADWATTLDSNPSFQRFLAYARENAPPVLELLKQFAVMLFRFAEAAAPAGTFVVDAFTQLFEWINKIPIDVLETVVAAIGGAAAGLVLFATVTAAINLGWAGAIIAGIAAIVAGAVVLYETVTPFRAFLDGLWQSIATGAVFVWQQILVPAFAAIGAAAAFLWTNYLYPLGQVFATTFTAIGAVVAVFWRDVGHPVFSAIGWLITTVTGPALRWFYTAVVKPIFEAIGVAFTIAGALFQVLAGLWQIGTKLVAGIALTWYYTQVKPIFDKLRPLFSWLGSVISEHVAPHWRTALAALAVLFNTFLEAAKVPIKLFVEVVLNNGLLKAYNTLAKAFNVKPDDVHIDLPKGWNTKPPVTRFADGGILPGYTPGRDVHTFVSPRTGARLELSGGEAVIRPEGTTALGPAWVEGINAAARTRGVTGVQDFLTADATPARSGRQPVETGDGFGDLLRSVRDKAGDVVSDIGSVASIVSDPAGAIRHLADKLIALIPGTDSTIGRAIVAVPRRVAQILIDQVSELFTGDEGARIPTSGGIGSAPMMRILHGPFPDLPLISGYRPHAITATGHPSYHGKIAANGEKGRAVDVPPLMRVFDFLHDAFPDSRELIFTPAGKRQIWNGHPHLYHGVTAADHYNHVHWALRNGGILPKLYDDGGYLPPGLSVVANGTGRPEPVFSDGQWKQLAAATRHSEPRPGAQYQFQFRDSTLTPARLRALQDREDALNRVHRTR